MNASSPNSIATAPARLFFFLSALCVHLFGNSLAATAQETDHLLGALRIETVTLETEKALDCQSYTPEALGFTLVGKVPIRDSQDLTAAFRLHIFRVAAIPPAIGSPASPGAPTVYRDYVLAGHYWSEAAVDAMQAFLLSEGVDERMAIADLPCTYRSDKDLFFYAPLASVKGDLWHLERQLQPFRFDLLDMQATDEDMVEALPPVDEQAQAVEAAEEIMRPYGWVPETLLKQVVASEDVFVLDRFECNKEGNFFIGSTAEIVDAPSSDLTQPVQITRTAMYAVTNYVGASDASDDDRASVEASVDPSHYWCIPKQEFCYKKIKFGQFGVQSIAGETKQVSRNMVYNLRLGLVSVIQQITNEYCTQSADARLR